MRAPREQNANIGCVMAPFLRLDAEARRSLLVRLAALAGVFAADRLAKVWARERLEPRFSIPVLPFFHLTYVENTGAAFGIGRSRNGFFIALTLTLLGLLCYLRRGWPRRDRWLESGFLLVAGGALGNLYDRMCYGFVVDFLDFRIWPVFNLADSCVTVGACCLAWGLSRREKKSPRP